MLGCVDCGDVFIPTLRGRGRGTRSILEGRTTTYRIYPLYTTTILLDTTWYDDVQGEATLDGDEDAEMVRLVVLRCV